MVQVKSAAAESFPAKDFFPNNSSYKSIDTSLNEIQKYFLNNFSYSLGLSNRKLFFESSYKTGFKSGIDYLDLFGYNQDEIKYYHTRTPYTEIFALFGQKKEQYFRLLHTQNITRQWNIALNMLRLRDEGFYQRQNCTDNNISISSNYTSKNNRYSLLANGIISSIKTDENGGVRNDPTFESNLLVNKKLIPINLPDARIRRGNREFYINQFWNFGKKDTVRVNDTTHYVHIQPRSSISLSTRANDNWFVYDDKNPRYGYYKNIFYDSLKTLDSTHTTILENEVSFKHLFKGGTKHDTSLLGYDISLKNQMVQIKGYATDSSLNKVSDSIFNNLFATGTFHNSFLSVKMNYCFYGQSKNDFNISSEGKISLSSNSVLEIKGDAVQTNPSLLFNRYASNNFRWKNDFDKSFMLSGSLRYLNRKNKFNLASSYSRIENYVYLNANCMPQRLTHPLTVFEAEVEKKFTLKKLHFNNKITYQQASDSNIVHLPQFVSTHSFYYEDFWFKKALNMQMGIDVSFYTSYYADAYMPAIGLYYLQNDTKTGNYPYIDFFFNMKIKHVRFFFKSEHINSGLMGPYYFVPHNPAPDRSFKIGINWVFYD